MKQRLISAAFMIGIGLPFLVCGGLPSQVFLYVVLILCMYEASKISGKLNIAFFIWSVICLMPYKASISQVVLLPIYIIGIFCIGIFDKNTNVDCLCCMTIMAIMISNAIEAACSCFDTHRLLLLFVAGVSLICDAGAYFVGRKLGKHKLAERISPKKTIEGAIGGIVISALIGLAFAIYCSFFGMNKTLVIVLCFVLPIISELGDLAFSLIKRRFDIKDFSNLIPGHGGILDRFDSVVMCLLFMKFILVLPTLFI